MSLSASALVTWEQAKAFLTLKDEHRELYEPVIEKASGLVCKMARRMLFQQDLIEQLDAFGTDTILLSEYPVTAVSSLRIDRNRVFGDDTEVTGFYCEPHGVMTLPYLVKEGKGVIKVGYTAGYDVAGGKVPQDLQEAVMEVVSWLRKRVANNQIGIRSVSGPEGITTAFETMIPLHAANVIELYRRGE